MKWISLGHRQSTETIDMNYLQELFFEPASTTPATANADGSFPPASSTGLRAIWAICALAFVARCAMAFQHDVFCDDGYFYVSVAHALGEHNFDGAFHYLSLNLYPIILLGLHKIGLSWGTGAEFWGVFISCLTLFPLFGLVRRLFSERIAILSCLLFTLHTELIEMSVEPIRGQTFWFALVLFFYVAYRAFYENSPRMFFAMGLSFAAAAHLRTEGWFLLCPMMIWAFIAWRRQTEKRWRIPAQVMASLALTPCLILLVNVTLLRDHHRWELGRGKPLLVLYDWFQEGWGRVSGEPVTLLASNAPVIPTEPAPNVEDDKIPVKYLEPVFELYPVYSLTEVPAVYAHHLIGTFEIFNVCLLLIGFYFARHTWKQRDKWAVYAFVLVTMAAVWIRLSQLGPINGRYFITVVILLLPIQAYGLIGLGHLLLKLHIRTTGRFQNPRLLATGLALGLVLFSVGDAVTSHHPARQRQASFGTWVHETFGNIKDGMCDHSAARVAYYAFDSVPYGPLVGHSFLRRFEERNPEMLIVTKRSWQNENQKYLKSWTARNGFRQLEDDQIPADGHNFIVYTRRPPNEVQTVKPIQVSASEVIQTH